MTVSTIAVGECCPTCGRRVPKARTKPVATSVASFPDVLPAPGAEALLADHLERRASRAPKTRRGRHEHPDDHRLRRDFPELVRFLREAEAGGRVTRFYAAPDPGDVMIELAGPLGVFHPIPAITIGVAELEARASGIADGTAWRELEPVATVAA